MAVSGTGQGEMPQSLVTPAFAGFPPIAENSTKVALTTGMTTDRKIFDFLPRRGIMTEIEYPGIAKLVSRLVWDQETVRSSRTTRTKSPLKSLVSEGFSYSLSIAAQGLSLSFSTYLFDKRRLNIVILPNRSIIILMDFYAFEDSDCVSFILHSAPKHIQGL